MTIKKKEQICKCGHTKELHGYIRKDGTENPRCQRNYCNCKEFKEKK